MFAPNSKYRLLVTPARRGKVTAVDEEIGKAALIERAQGSVHVRRLEQAITRIDVAPLILLNGFSGIRPSDIAREVKRPQ